MKNIILALSVLLLVTSCATANMEQGQDFDTSKIEQIQEGKTTQAEVLSMFGKPYQVTKVSSGMENWLYLRSKTSSEARSYVFKMDVQTSTNQKSLYITFVDGVVTQYVFNGGQPNTSTMKVQ